MPFILVYDIILVDCFVEFCCLRRVDELGRVVIPIELRNKFGIAEKDPIEIYVEGSNIILKKYEPNCVFCGSSKNLIEYKGKLVCDKCLKQMSELK